MKLSNNELDATVALCAAIVGLLAFANEFPDKSYFKVVKSLGFKLILFVVATFIGIWATLKKNNNIDNEKITEKLESQKEQRANDKANREFTTKSNAYNN